MKIYHPEDFKELEYSQALARAYSKNYVRLIEVDSLLNIIKDYLDTEEIDKHNRKYMSNLILKFLKQE